ncbi:MAG TPA: homoserine kinase [Vicinamibacteria bacterium]|nr:homoserine kinase [Vicinamibacteria bacterium]
MTEAGRSSAFAPATIANVACGFDVLGLALETPGDTVTAERQVEPGVSLSRVEGDSGRLPRDPDLNTATIAARTLLESQGLLQTTGVRLTVSKGLPLAGGLGSSAASAVAAVIAVCDLIGLDLSKDELLPAVVESERVVSGSGHADNAAACLYGGLVLVRSVDPVDVVELPVPNGLAVAVLHPHLEMSTRDSRRLLGDEIPLTNAVLQWANVGALVAGLYSGNLPLVSRALVDVVAEPVRSPHVPRFHQVKNAALGAGALGCSLAGSGPSMFALCAGLTTAHEVSMKMLAAFDSRGAPEPDLFVSPVSARGARLLS